MCYCSIDNHIQFFITGPANPNPFIGLIEITKYSQLCFPALNKRLLLLLQIFLSKYTTWAYIHMIQNFIRKDTFRIPAEPLSGKQCVDALSIYRFSCS